MLRSALEDTEASEGNEIFTFTHVFDVEAAAPETVEAAWLADGEASGLVPLRRLGHALPSIGLILKVPFLNTATAFSTPHTPAPLFFNGLSFRTSSATP